MPPSDLTIACVEMVQRRLMQALEERDAVRRYGLLCLARADLGATVEHAMVDAHQAAGTVPAAKPAARQLELTG